MATMTYEQSSALMNNVPFRGRIKVACLQYAAYKIGEPANTPGHSSAVRWAQTTFNAPDQTAMQIQPMVAMDPAVRDAGLESDGDSSVTDEVLQVAVELTVNKIL